MKKVTNFFASRMRACVLLVCLLIATLANAQNLKVTGTVVDNSGEPVIGATVRVKGSNTGVITNANGKYTIDCPSNGTLEFTFIGSQTAFVPVDGKSTINVTLKDESKALDEVVVTALGIKREAKSLAYAAQTVGGKDVNEIKNVNMINSLQGKSAGLQITPNSTGAGGASKILFRGSKSINGNNQPLIVVDGVPLMMNISDNQVSGNYGAQRDGGDALSTINPDDIAQITLLKGASAAALYGAVAANGAIMITTKSAQSGKVSVNLSSNTTLQTPISLPKFQTEYGVSDNGTFSWGERLQTPAKNYAKEFFRTGLTTNNTVSIAGGSKNLSSYFSYANIYSKGITPQNDFRSHNFLAKIGFNLLEKVHVDVSAGYNNQHVTNQAASGFLENPLTGVYLFPRGENWAGYKENFEVFSPALNTKVQNWTNVKQEQFSNPYWSLNRQTPISDKTRYNVGGSVKYDIIDGLSLTGRLRYERGDDHWSLNEYASSVGGRFAYGNLKDSRYFNEQLYGDVLATYNHVWNKIYAFTVTAGASFTKTKTSSTSLIGWGEAQFESKDGKPSGNVYYPNIFMPENYYRMTTNFKLAEKRLNSVFGTAQFGYKDAWYVDVTARNDWSSTLAFTPNVSFFYPSVGTSLLLDKFVKLGKNVDMLKLRASYSIVGNDVPVFMTNLRYTLNGQSLTPPKQAPFTTLKPEKTHSLEVGIDGAFFDNRLEANLTYYKTNTKNQFFAIDAPFEKGLRKQYVNAGNVQNQGFEVSLSWTQDFTPELSWVSRYNFSYNINEIKELVPGLADGLTLANYGGAMVILKQGGHYGDLYVRQLVKDESGKPVVNDGAPVLGSENVKDLKYIGDMTPRVNMGWSNTIRYKNFTLNFLIDGKFGGKVLSMTEATLDGWGVSARSGAARNAGKVVYDGVTYDAQKFYKTVGATNFNSQYANELYIYKATNVRMRELSLGYTFRNLLGHGKNLTASLIGRNLFFFYKDAPMDPDVSVGTGNGWQGVDVFSLPTTRSMGLNLKLNF